MTTSKTQSANLAAVLKDCRQKVIDNLPLLTQAAIDQAVKGSCPHTKFLFDFVNAIPAKEKDDEDDPPGPSLAAYLIERLHLQPPPDDDDDMPAGPSVYDFGNRSATSTDTAESV